jgi:hypothetical protein
MGTVLDLRVSFGTLSLLLGTGADRRRGLDAARGRGHRDSAIVCK